MHIAVCGLGYGDEGKGTVVDALCARTRPRAVVRFNGGPQAGHNVVQPDGRHHCFSQFGSGSFHGIPTFLSRYMAVNPMNLLAEANGLREVGISDPLSLMAIDRECLVVTPYHRAMQREREKRRGGDRHGSCGSGFGEAVEDFVEARGGIMRVRDLMHPRTILATQLERLRDEFGTSEELRWTPRVEAIEMAYQAFFEGVHVVDGKKHLRMLLNDGDVVFEGAQGVLLDQDYGFHPYTTWSRTDFRNADALVAEAGHEVRHLGVLRHYTTRHGPGPHVADIPAFTESLDDHNQQDDWQGRFRVGHFDKVAHRYAIQVCNRVDALAVTHLDQNPFSQYVDRYVHPDGKRFGWLKQHWVDDFAGREKQTQMLLQCVHNHESWPDDFYRADAIEEMFDLNVTVRSTGPTLQDKTYRYMAEGLFP